MLRVKGMERKKRVWFGMWRKRRSGLKRLEMEEEEGNYEEGLRLWGEEEKGRNEEKHSPWWEGEGKGRNQEELETR